MKTKLTIGLLATARIHYDAEGLMAQEDAYLAALQKATNYRIVGAELQLGPAEGVSRSLHGRVGVQGFIHEGHHTPPVADAAGVGFRRGRRRGRGLAVSVA